ncbi:MAG: VCBS repeat-containing protein, partial [Bacteroidota bacterium]
MVDINADGWLDIYVSKLGDYKMHKNTNKLFINYEGKKFVNEASTYGLDFSGFSTQAAFLDYDQDGDLDCYLLNHSAKDPAQYKPAKIRNQKDSIAGDVFYENVDGKFIDVTKQAGIYNSSIGFGLGIDVVDVNEDRLPDIYIANDFHEQDYLYINQGNKTFKEQIEASTQHTSNFSMGCNITDINNDGLQDILTLDMKPFVDSTYKLSGGWENIEIYNFKRSYGYHHQSPRNALQVNLGVQNGIPQFSEQACLYGIEASDWSWSPIIEDFDNDGDQDIFITNGILRRPNDMDFVNFHFDDPTKSDLEKIQMMPKGAVSNLYFKKDNESNRFKRSKVGTPSCSTGAAVGDLDNDGLLEIVVSSINKGIEILKPNVNENHYLNIKLESNSDNSNALGAK